MIGNSRTKLSPIKTRIDYRGRIYIPIEVRRTLHLKPNIEIYLECKDDMMIFNACPHELMVSMQLVDERSFRLRDPSISWDQYIQHCKLGHALLEGIWTMALAAWVAKTITLRVGGSKIYEGVGIPTAIGFIIGLVIITLIGGALLAIRFFYPF